MIPKVIELYLSLAEFTINSYKIAIKLFWNNLIYILLVLASLVLSKVMFFMVKVISQNSKAYSTNLTLKFDTILCNTFPLMQLLMTLYDSWLVDYLLGASIA